MHEIHVKTKENNWNMNKDKIVIFYYLHNKKSLQDTTLWL